MTESAISGTSRFMASPPSSPDYTEVTLTTGLRCVAYGCPPDEATGTVLGPVTIPPARIDPDSGLSIPGKMTVVSYAWTGYSSPSQPETDVPPYRFMAWWIDSSGIAPPGWSWATRTTLGADLGTSTVDGIAAGDGFNVDPLRGPVVDGTYAYPMSDYRLSGEILFNPTSVPVDMYLNCRNNGYFHSEGSWSMTTKVRLSAIPVHGKAWLRGHVARAAVL